MSVATDILLNAKDSDALSVATPYLNLCASVLSGALLVKAVANGLRAGDGLATSMASLARYHALSVMPRAGAQLDFIRAGADPVFNFPVGQLADL
jgi:hypothetical protein